MKITAIIIRILLGGSFVVFGLNGFLHFLKMGEQTGVAAAFFGGMHLTGYMLPLVFGTQLAGGLLVLTGVFVPLGLILLAPVLLNIVLFHGFLVPAGIQMGLVFTVLELALVWFYRGSFAGVLKPFAKITPFKK